jgi:hypothetical protein
MKLEIVDAMLALQAQDAPALASRIFYHFGVLPLELKTVIRGIVTPRAGVIVVPDKFMSYAFGELVGPNKKHWGFSCWSFSVTDPHDYPYLLFT